MESFDFLTHLPAVMPEVGLMALVIILLAADVGFLGIIRPLPESRKHYMAYIAGVGLLVVATFPVIWAPDPNAIEPFYWGGMIRHDVMAQIFRITVMVAGAFTCFMATGAKTLERNSEFYLIIVVATMGASLLSASADLIMIFVALETLSIPLYILAAFNRDDVRSNESGMKYFLFGSFASAIMVYGFSLLFGFSGHTNIYAIAEFMTSNAMIENAVPVVAAMVMVIVGFGFKISVVPFHFWTPDVYEGAPTAVTAFVSVASKAASFAILVRFLIAVFPETVVFGDTNIQEFWVAGLSAAAVFSMTLGNIVALTQRNIKRLLAYSSIAQAGYVLIGVAAISQSPEQGVAAAAFYLIMYTFTNLLAFSVVIIFSEQTGTEEISDLAGMSRRNPWVALAMTLALLSLAGIPPTAGFFGKFFLFNAAVDAGLVWLAIVGVLNAIIGLYYYLVVVKVIYVNRSEEIESKPLTVSATYAWILGATTVAVLLLGIVPAFVFDSALLAAQSL